MGGHQSANGDISVTTQKMPSLLRDMGLYFLFLILPLALYAWLAQRALNAHKISIQLQKLDWLQSAGTIITIVGLGMGYCGVRALIDRTKNRKKRIDQLWVKRLRHLFTPATLLRLAVLLVCDTFLVVVYLTLKQFTPILNPGLCDQELIVLDQLIHFGYNPYPDWVALWPGRSMTHGIQILYTAWFGLKIPIFAYFMFRSTPRSIQFFSSYFLLFIIAGSIAIALPSLGPYCVIRHQTIDAERAGTPSDLAFKYASRWYDRVLQDHTAYQRNSIGGLAAFPSLHVGMVALAALFFCKTRRIRWLFLIYWFIIQFGSVYLGWHYAIDGYFSTLLVVVIVWATGQCVHSLTGEPVLNPLSFLRSKSTLNSSQKSSSQLPP